MSGGAIAYVNKYLQNKAATAADVAAVAGVSRTTVSHILNGRDARFPEATKEKVRNAAHALDYRPSPAGRSLASGRGDTIIVLMPNITIGQNMQELLERLTKSNARIKPNVVLRFADDDMKTTVDGILRLHPLAVVDIGALDDAARKRLKSNGVLTVPDAEHAFMSDGAPLDYAIAQMQVKEATKRGTRPVIYAASDEEKASFLNLRRRDAINAACKSAGMGETDQVLMPTSLDAAIDVLGPKLGSGPIAVIAYNDFAALTALAVSRELDLAIPDQVSVIGVDGTNVGRLWKPRLTSINVNMSILMDAAAEDILKFLNEPTEIPSNHAVKEALVLIPGEST